LLFNFSQEEIARINEAASTERKTLADAIENLKVKYLINYNVSGSAYSRN
jgi:hypothetical protein